LCFLGGVFSADLTAYINVLRFANNCLLGFVGRLVWVNSTSGLAGKKFINPFEILNPIIFLRYFSNFPLNVFMPWDDTIAAGNLFH